jgi:hypothetical protein
MSKPNKTLYVTHLSIYTEEDPSGWTNEDLTGAIVDGDAYMVPGQRYTSKLPNGSSTTEVNKFFEDKNESQG